jgi:hypothetical protein
MATLDTLLVYTMKDEISFFQLFSNSFSVNFIIQICFLLAKLLEAVSFELILKERNFWLNEKFTVNQS